MKKLFIAVISMAALASCTQEDIVINNANNAIAFDNAFVSATTKAIDPSITTASIADFQVWGNTQGDHTNAPVVPIFENETVRKDSVSGIWTYNVNKTQYWIDGNIYNFAAVKNGTVTELADGLPKTINYSLSGTTGPDLLYASYGPYEAEATGNSEVPFTFAHLLSKAVFTFENTTPDKKDGATTQPANIYKVTNIQISGLDANANYDVASNEWKNNADGDCTENFGNIVGADSKQENKEAEPISEKQSGKSNYERLLIPGTHNVTITCKITLYNDTVADNRIVDVIDYNKTVQLTFEKGVAYNLILQAGLEQSIEFKVVEVENWNNPYENVDTHEQGHDNTPSA